MEPHEIWTIIGMFAAVVVSIIFSTIASKRESHIDIEKRITDAEEKAASKARTDSKLDEISSDVKDIKADTKSMRADFSALSEKVSVIDNKVEYAHHRIDVIVGKRMEGEKK